jgi:ligand-binding sensor domain-containing protein
VKNTHIVLCCAIAFLVSCTVDAPGRIHAVRGAWVYNIKQHNDSIYFSTSEQGIFSFHPDRPQAVRRVGGCRRLPFRTLWFTKENTLLASSYYAGVFRAEKDTLLPVAWAQYPAWAMKLDENENIWLASAQGVLRQKGESLERFCGVRDAHDVAFFNDQVAVAHMKGMSLYNRENGALVRDFARGLVCWSVTAYDTLLIGGGIERCLVISRDGTYREIRFGPPRNILWATALDSCGELYLATQQGLYRARLSDSVAVCVGFENVCLKSLFIDNKGRIWVARFAKTARWRLF